MFSFWETQSFLHYDYIIIGSGIVGLSTAATLLENKPNCKVLILERGILPSGASTKNAGFACYGSLTEVLSDLKIMPENKVVALVQLRYEGLQKLLQRLGKEKCGYEAYGGYELLFDDNQDAIEKIEILNALLYPVFNESSIVLKNDVIETFGFQQVKNMVYHPFEGQIDTGKMMKNLIAYVQQLGATIITGCEVKNYEVHNNIVQINCLHQLHQTINFSAKAVAFCTNAFTKTFFPAYNIKPGRGQVLITKPLPTLSFKGVFHFDEGYYYFRNVGNRVLLGGGRNLDFENETTTNFGTTALIIDDLKEKLNYIILPNQSYEIDQIWSGIMAFGNDKFPIIEKVQPKIIVAARLGGMGVAIGSKLGEQAAALLIENT